MKTDRSLSSLLPFFRFGVIAGIVAVLLTLAPFAVAQDVHHELAAADSDGHEHSDHDLCQWVQHHTSGSIDLGGPVFSAWKLVSQHDVPPQSTLLSVEFVSVGPSRAPPLT
jgi:hypothetical protein